MPATELRCWREETDRDRQGKQTGDNRKGKTHGDTKEAGGEVVTITLIL